MLRSERVDGGGAGEMGETEQAERENSLASVEDWSRSPSRQCWRNRREGESEYRVCGVKEVSKSGLNARRIMVAP